jgi:hypothetical protein
MTTYDIVTKDNLGKTLKLGHLVSNKLDVQVDNVTIFVDSNGVLSVNQDYNYLVFETVGEQQSWSITHNFGRKPMIQVYNMDNTQVWAMVQHLSNNQIQILNDKPRAGYAIISI